MLKRLLQLLPILFLAACLPATPVVPTPAPTLAQPTVTPMALATATPVVPTPTALPSGVLQGKVIIGPLSPVVKLGTPTAVPPAETYTTRGIYIFLEDGKTALKKLMFLPDGTYRIELPEGKYVIDYISIGKDRAKNLPQPVVIQKGKTTQLDLEIDTGIR